MSNYFGFTGAGEINRAAAIALLDSHLPQDDVEIVVPQTMQSPGLIELYNWLDVEFTGIETSDSNIVDHLRLLATDGHKTTLILLRDDEHPEDDVLKAAYNAGITVLDLGDSLHPIEWKAPAAPPKGGRRRKAEPEPGSQEAIDAYQQVSNEIREAAEQAETIEVHISGPATKGPQWAERFEQDGTRSAVDRAIDDGAPNTTYLAQELVGTLIVLISRMVTQEVSDQMSLTPGVRATTENFGQSTPAVPEPVEDAGEAKLPYLLNKESGRYTPREGKKGRPPKGSEVVYLAPSEINALVYKGLVDASLETQLELPFD